MTFSTSLYSLTLLHLSVTVAQNFDPMQRWGYVNIPGWTCVDGLTIIGCDIRTDCLAMSAQCFDSTIYTAMWYSNVNPCCYPKFCDNPSPNPGIAVCSWQSCAATTYWSTSSAANGGCTSCPAGSRCPGDFNSYPCTQGLYSQGGAADCTLCPPGTANPLDGQSTCPQCLQNTYSPGGLPNCIPCEPGTESSSGASSCAPIPTPTASSTGSSTSTSSSSNSSSPTPSFSSSSSYSSTKSFSSSPTQSFSSSSSPNSPQLASAPIAQYQTVIGSVGGVLGIVSLAGWAFAAYLALRLRRRKDRNNRKSNVTISTNQAAAMGDLYTETVPLMKKSTSLRIPLLATESSTPLRVT